MLISLNYLRLFLERKAGTPYNPMRRDSYGLIKRYRLGQNPLFREAYGANCI
jgi:hypothetical protein